MRFTRLCLICGLFFSIPSVSAQWAWDIDDYTLLFNKDSIQDKKIKTCTVDCDMVKEAWFTKYWYLPEMDMNMVFHFNQKGQVTKVRYWGWGNYEFWQYRFEYNEEGNLVLWVNEHVVNDVQDKLREQISYTYTNGRRSAAFHTYGDSTDNHVIWYCYRDDGRHINDSSKTTCLNCPYKKNYAVSDYRWHDNNTWFEHEHEEYDGDDFSILYDTWQANPERITERETRYHSTQFQYNTSGQLEKMRNIYERRSDGWDYGCAFGIPKRFLGGSTAGTKMDYVFHWEKGIITGMDVMNGKSKKAHFSFLYEYF